MNYIEERFVSASEHIEFVLVATVESPSHAHALTRLLGRHQISWRTLRVVGNGPTEAWRVLVDDERVLEAGALFVRQLFKGRRLVCEGCGWGLDGAHGPCPGCVDVPLAATA